MIIQSAVHFGKKIPEIIVNFDFPEPARRDPPRACREILGLDPPIDLVLASKFIDVSPIPLRNPLFSFEKEVLTTATLQDESCDAPVYLAHLPPDDVFSANI